MQASALSHQVVCLSTCIFFPYALLNIDFSFSWILHTVGYGHILNLVHVHAANRKQRLRLIKTNALISSNKNTIPSRKREILLAAAIKCRSVRCCFLSMEDGELMYILCYTLHHSSVFTLYSLQNHKFHYSTVAYVSLFSLKKKHL